MNSPYPQSSDRVTVVVFCKKTGRIKQKVECSLTDAHRQHGNWDEHDYIEIDDKDCQPHTHIVDLDTYTLKKSVHVTEIDKTHKRLDLRDAAEAAAPMPKDLTSLMLRAASGDPISQGRCATLAGQRETAQERLETLTAQVQKTQTKEELEKIKW